MMTLVAIAAVILIFATAPAVMFVINLRRYRALRAGITIPLRVAVLIPARNEEHNIGPCVRSILASVEVDFEVVVVDDASMDRTAETVRELASGDARVRLVSNDDLPDGWNGKQHACWLLAQETTAPLLLFLDADVRLAPDALRLCVSEMQTRNVALLSGFPRQITVGWMEQLLLPLILFVLLAFLPMGRMRRTTKTGYAAGCGQFFLANRDAYFASGGHAKIRQTRHDGLRLPHLFRRSGFRTDVVDLTQLAEVRMYTSGREVWMGLTKNATEGIGSPARIVPFTLILLFGQILPLIAGTLWLAFCVSNVVIGASFNDPGMAIFLSILLSLAILASYLPRLLAVRRFKQPLHSALLHPLGITILLFIQWYALAKRILGRPVVWRARAYSSGTGEEVSNPQAHGEGI